MLALCVGLFWRFVAWLHADISWVIARCRPNGSEDYPNVGLLKLWKANGWNAPEWVRRNFTIALAVSGEQKVSSQVQCVGRNVLMRIYDSAM